MAYPTIYPTGATVYNPEKCWNGYTVFQAKEVGATIIDMNGNVVRQIKNLHGFPNKLLPGGSLLGATGRRKSKFGYQDQKDLVQVDWEGNTTWKFDQWEYIEDPGEESRWMARQHHDFQREGNPVGYYVPGMEPLVDKGNTLILLHKNSHNPKITDKLLCDDVIVEVDWEGNIIWEWICSEHFDEFNFSEEAKNTLYRNPNMRMEVGEGVADWMHINSMSTLGPNKWFDNGDERFHPDNIIWDGRVTNILAITDKVTGKIVWQIGPDYNTSKALRKMGWIIGQHHAHMIPRGLPGEGNILVFDNGGWAGYGAPNPGSPTGLNNAQRDSSRILEFDPVTLEVVWKYTPVEAGFMPLADNYKFYSGYISGAQRLPNGNTLITEGADGRLFEVTPEYELVWEYVSPYFAKNYDTNMVYRSYRYPYEYIPQVDKPKEVGIPRIDRSTFKVPGTYKTEPNNVMTLESGDAFEDAPQLCIASVEEEDE
jgi:arylsulfotransferase ASST